MKKVSVLFMMLVIAACSISAADVFVEAESFGEKGGWKVDQQFMDIMGSPYLLAHGMGSPVSDARQEISVAQGGTYYIYVRTFNWTSPWKSGRGPGQFAVSIDGKRLPVTAGCVGDRWMWQYVGKTNIKRKNVAVILHDLTGFDGRCDAIYLSTRQTPPPSEPTALAAFRLKKTGATVSASNYDFVVAGAGIAGMCAAVAAARQGLKVALINDRPVLGGNNSSEIRVHLGGRINLKPYDHLGNLLKEFAPTREGNAQPAEYYGDDAKMKFIKGEKNITLFTNTHVIKAKTDGNCIKEIEGQNIESGKFTVFRAPLFADCTGDGALGALAGAEFLTGRESKDAYGEARAVDVADRMTMGASVQWYAAQTAHETHFPVFEYGVKFDEASAKKVVRGDWDWETGMNYDQVKEAERVRDYGLMVVYSNWSFLKNRSADKAKFADKQLAWVAYIDGKRESRRLVGDYVLNGNDITGHHVYPDATACTSWSIDLHEPSPENSKYFPRHEFLSRAVHTKIYPYPVPYRCLYSHNISNLLMAGRDVSVSHVALGTVRVMRTGGMLGEVVGLAASVCHRHDASPRDVYSKYFSELKLLMLSGAGRQGLPDSQEYNVGLHLDEIPQNPDK